MKINKKWAMPNKLTFMIKPIINFISGSINYSKDKVIIDPFANSSKVANITNDLDPQYKTTYNMDALDFLKQFDSNSVDVVLYDPPYSPRQVSESYKKLDMSVNMQTTQSSYWSKQKNEIARILKPNGKVFCFGWNSQGIGKTRGFEMKEILLVAHGGNHNDTICTLELKKR